MRRDDEGATARSGGGSEGTPPGPEQRQETEWAMENPVSKLYERLATVPDEQAWRAREVEGWEVHAFVAGGSQGLGETPMELYDRHLDNETSQSHGAMSTWNMIRAAASQGEEAEWQGRPEEQDEEGSEAYDAEAAWRAVENEERERDGQQGVSGSYSGGRGLMKIGTRKAEGHAPRSNLVLEEGLDERVPHSITFYLQELVPSPEVARMCQAGPDEVLALALGRKRVPS